MVGLAPARTSAAPDTSAALARAQASVVVLAKPQLLPVPPASTQPVDTLRPYRPSRFSLEFLLGTGWTHRHLAVDTFGLSGAERGTLAPQAQLLAGFRLSRQLRLLVGAGLTSFRQRLRFRTALHDSVLVSYTDSVRDLNTGLLTAVTRWRSVDSVTTGVTDARAALRYLSLPILLDWHAPLGDKPRWRLRLTGGPVLLLALGSRYPVTDTDCHCADGELQLRPRALAVQAAAGLEFALTPDWWLTFQPTGSLVLTSVTTPTQPVPGGTIGIQSLRTVPGVSARYPYSAGLQVGLRYEFPVRLRRALRP